MGDRALSGHKVGEGFWYFMGFVQADGQMVVSSSGNKYIRVWNTEKDLIDLCYGITGGNRIRGKVYLGDRICYYYDLYDPWWVENAWAIGVRPRKSLVWTYLKVPRKGLSHWMRGFTDGDGCVEQGTYAMVSWTFGRKTFANWFQMKLSLICATKGKPTRNHTAWKCVVGGRQARIVLRSMYYGATIFGKRKKLIADGYLSAGP